MFRVLVSLLILILAGFVSAQPTVTRDTNRRPIEIALRYFTDPAIQAELKLTDEQKAKIAKIPDELLAKEKVAIEKQEAEAKEAIAKQQAKRLELQKAMDNLIEKELTAEQRKRLEQLVTQSMGVGAFRREDIAKALSLTDADQKKLTAIVQEGRAKWQKEFPNFNPFTSDAETQSKYLQAQRKLPAETVAKFIETFSDEQKKAWKALTGEPIKGGIFPNSISPTGVGAGTVIDRAMSRAAVLTYSDVLDELKLDKPARERVATALVAIREPMLRGNPIPQRTIPIPLLLRQDAVKNAREVLTAAQLQRLDQIWFQVRGISVFTVSGGRRTPIDTPIQSSHILRLTPTPAQAAKIDAVLAAVSTKQAEIQDEDIEVRKRKISAVLRPALAEIVATFDVGQKAVWKELTGEPFDVSTITTLNPLAGEPGFAGIGVRPRTLAMVWSFEARRRVSRGEYASALTVYDEAIRLAPSNTDFWMEKARLLATCPSEWVCDGKQAVELMNKVMMETKQPTARQYDIQASALAEAGRFDEAVKAQLKAIDMLPNATVNSGFGTTLKEQSEARLKLYQEKKPYRMPAPRTVGTSR